MGQPAQQSVEIKEFIGLQSRQDPNDVQPGAGTYQVNATVQTPGQLTVRPGMLQVTFEDD